MKMRTFHRFHCGVNLWTVSLKTIHEEILIMRALICGVSGQDGSYLAEFLLNRGYSVFGTSRDAKVNDFKNLHKLGIHNRVKTISMAINDFRSVITTIKEIQPLEIYNLAGQSSVALSFEQPVETLESITIGTLNLLESIRFLDENIRFYNAASSECFGDTGGVSADEKTPFQPRSPYAVAKAAAFWEVANYREAYGLKACSGILFNHESPLRPERFVTKKIIQAACNISTRKQDKLMLGNLSISRDWGWAPEYVEAMWKMIQLDKLKDFVIATGTSYSLESFVCEVFAQLNLDWREYVSMNTKLLRPSEIAYSCGNPAKAGNELGWVAKSKMKEVVAMMIKSCSVDDNK